jgi:glycosyltransferase involved in cell wall biosynthesis
MPRLLLVLPQLPQDPASGAARSMVTICGLLARAGWEIRALATTATESVAPIAATDFLRAAGHEVATQAPNRTVYQHDRPVLEFVERGIRFRLVDSLNRRAFAEPEEHRTQFNRIYQHELAGFRPKVVFGFGGSPADIERFHRAKTAGARVVFGLRNYGYRDGTWLRGLDAVLTPSRFLSDAYHAALGLESVALPSPIEIDDVVAPNREPIFFTAVNPTREKGACFLARLAEELATRRPDLPMLFIESRGGASDLVNAGLAGGFDLRRHESLMFAPAVPRPAEFFRGTRVLLAPSVWDEPFGRVAAEALLNGVPPVVSDRGGLPEAANGGGFVLPLPAALTPATTTPVGADEVRPWLEVIERLADDTFYATASARARAAGEAYLPQNLAPRYLEFFERVLKP